MDVQTSNQTSAPVQVQAPEAPQAQQQSEGGSQHVQADNNNVGQANVQSQDVQDKQDSKIEIKDLSAAFEEAEKNNRTRSADNVPEGAEEEPKKQDDNGQTTDVNNQPANNEQPNGKTQADRNVGDNTNYASRYTVNQLKQWAGQDVKNKAYAEADKILEENGVRRLTLEDIQRQDESNERIMWLNPHDKNNPFTTMKEAREFIKEYNEELDAHRTKLAKEKAPEIAKAYMPAIALEEFRPTYNSMTDVEKEICGILTAPYTLRNKAGRVVGFNCNLNNYAQMAKQIAKKFSNQKPIEPVSTPTLDAKTSSSVGSEKEMDINSIKTLEDAFKFEKQKNRKDK